MVATVVTQWDVPCQKAQAGGRRSPALPEAPGPGASLGLSAQVSRAPAPPYRAAGGRGSGWPLLRCLPREEVRPQCRGGLMPSLCGWAQMLWGLLRVPGGLWVDQGYGGSLRGQPCLLRAFPPDSGCVPTCAKDRPGRGCTLPEASGIRVWIKGPRGVQVRSGLDQTEGALSTGMDGPETWVPETWARGSSPPPGGTVFKPYWISRPEGAHMWPTVALPTGQGASPPGPHTGSWWCGNGVARGWAVWGL